MKNVMQNIKKRLIIIDNAITISITTLRNELNLSRKVTCYLTNTYKNELRETNTGLKLDYSRLSNLCNRYGGQFSDEHYYCREGVWVVTNLGIEKMEPKLLKYLSSAQVRKLDKIKKAIHEESLSLFGTETPTLNKKRSVKSAPVESFSDFIVSPLFDSKVYESHKEIFSEVSGVSYPENKILAARMACSKNAFENVVYKMLEQSDLTRTSSKRLGYVWGTPDPLYSTMHKFFNIDDLSETLKVNKTMLLKILVDNGVIKENKEVTTGSLYGSYKLHHNSADITSAHTLIEDNNSETIVATYNKYPTEDYRIKYKILYNIDVVRRFVERSGIVI